MADVDTTAELLRRADLITPMAIRVAATLGMVDRVAERPRSAAELAELTGSTERPLRKVADHLVEIGVLAVTDDGRYGPGELGAPLRDTGQPGNGLRELLNTEHIVGRSELALVGLLHTVRTGGSAYEAHYGTSLWRDFDRDDHDLDEAAFDWDAPGFDAQLVLEDPLWENARTVVDVGGGTGAMFLALLRRHEHLSGHVVDLPRLARRAGERIREAGLSDRGTALGGDFNTDLPGGADVYLLSAVLGDWGDDAAVEVLRAVCTAAGETGTVVLAELHMTSAATNPEAATAAAVRLEAGMARPDREPGELRALLERAGLEVVAEPAPTTTRSMFVARPAAVLTGGAA